MPFELHRIVGGRVHDGRHRHCTYPRQIRHRGRGQNAQTFPQSAPTLRPQDPAVRLLPAISPDWRVVLADPGCAGRWPVLPVSTAAAPRPIFIADLTGRSAPGNNRAHTIGFLNIFPIIHTPRFYRKEASFNIVSILALSVIALRDAYLVPLLGTRATSPRPGENGEAKRGNKLSNEVRLRGKPVSLRTNLCCPLSSGAAASRRFQALMFIGLPRWSQRPRGGPGPKAHLHQIRLTQVFQRDGFLAEGRPPDVSRDPPRPPPLYISIDRTQHTAVQFVQTQCVHVHPLEAHQGHIPSMMPSPSTVAKSRMRFKKRFATRGVPRLRLASS